MAKNKTKKLLLPAAELIKQKKYDEAKEFLTPIDHPKAREWLAKVESRANARPKRNLPESASVTPPAPPSELDVLIQDLHLKARGIWLLYVGLAAAVVGLLALFLLIELSAPQSIQITLLELLLMAALLVVAFVLGAAAFGKWRANQALTERCQVVMQQRRVWGEPLCRAILQKQIAPTMRADMVLLAWGKPHYIDDQEITKTGVEKERWVYTSPRLGVRYIYFKNGEVDKIKT